MSWLQWTILGLIGLTVALVLIGWRASGSSGSADDKMGSAIYYILAALPAGAAVLVLVCAGLVKLFMAL